MRNNFRRLLLSPVPFALLASFSVLNLARQQGGFAQVSNFSNLTFEIATTNKKDFVRLEPIPIILTLSNKTAQTILGHRALVFSDNMVRLSVMKEGGKKQEIRQLSPFPKEIFIKPVEIKPGESYQAKELLTLNLDSIFPEPGEYHIYATLLDPNSKQVVKSNIVTIHVLEPEGVDRQAFDFIQASSKSSDFLSGRYLSGHEEAQSTLERFVLNYGGSAYGDYATFLLGELYFEQGEDDKAGEQFLRLSKKPDFVFADKVSDYRVKLKARAPGLNRV